jgi:uncharacterized DUF497 family protein
MKGSQHHGSMQFSCDPNKSRANYFKHGIVLEFAQYLDWAKKMVWQDERQNYNEFRMRGLVPLEGRTYSVVYVLRAESTRMISLRKANKREAKHYEKNQ